MYNFTRPIVRIFWIVITLFVVILFMTYEAGATGDAISPLAVQLRFGLALLLIVLSLLVFQWRAPRSDTGNVLLVLLLFFLFYSNNVFLGRIFDINIYTSMSLWIFVYMFFYSFFSITHVDAVMRDRVVFFYVILFLVLFLWNYYRVALSGMSHAFIESYFMLTIFPFVVLMRNSAKKMILIFLISLCVLLAAKRTGVVVLSVLLFLYFCYSLHGDFKRKMWLVLGLLVFIPCFGFILNHFFSEEWGYVLNRFSSISDDGGSGRDIVYATLYKNIIGSAGTVDFFLGNGYNSVVWKSGIGFSAHNDFLEVFYDFGLVGFLIYISFVISLLCKIFNRKLSRELRFSTLLSVAVFVLLSFFSHMILSTTSILCLCAFWGYVDAFLKCNFNSYA